MQWIGSEFWMLEPRWKGSMPLMAMPRVLLSRDERGTAQNELTPLLCRHGASSGADAGISSHAS